MQNNTDLQGILKTKLRFRSKINHIKHWNKWRKRSLNSPINKFLVLIGLIHSPTFILQVLTDEEIRKS